MKSMSCKELGGACEKVFSAETFEEIVELSKQHGMEMFQQQDEVHLEAMAMVQEMMMNPEAMQVWFESKKQEFEALPSN